MSEVELALVRLFIHREVCYEAHIETVLVDNFKSLAEGRSYLTGKKIYNLDVVAYKEERVVSLEVKHAVKLRLLFGNEEFVNRTLEGTVRKHGKITEPLHAYRESIFEELFKEALALFAAAGSYDSSDGFALEGLKVNVREKLGEVANLKRIAKIRLIGAVFKHCLFKRYFSERSGAYLFAASEFCECVIENLFGYGENILLCGKGHFKVKLIELSRGTVGSCVLVAEAGSYLEIFVEARSHKQLLKLLRSLRQSIEFALVLS